MVDALQNAFLGIVTEKGLMYPTQMSTTANLSTMELSTRATSITLSITLAISAKVKEMKANGENVYAFGAGEPDFATPEAISNAAIQSLNDGVTH